MDTSASLAADLVPLLIKEKMLSLAEKDLVFFELADKEQLPEGQGKTIQFTRYERLALPALPATEGVTPTEQPLQTSVVQAVVDQWVAVVVLTDVAVLTIRHPVLRVAQDRLGHQHDETIDRECQKVLMGSSNVFFPNNQTARSALTVSDVLSTDVVRKVVSTLRYNGAMPFVEGKFVGVVDPFQEMDLSKDGTFINAASYSNIKALYVGEIGDWMGVRWKRSNYIPILSQMAATSYTIPAGGGAVGGGEVGFASGSSAIAAVTMLDPTTGFETSISPPVTVTAGAAYSVSVLIPSAAPTGTYNVYVSLQNGTVATLQQQFVHVVGTQTPTAGAALFIASGTPAASNHFVVQATGPVAPPVTPATGINIHFSYVFGKEAFGVTELGGLQTFLTPPTPTDSDPAVQRRKASWKQIFKAVIKNPAFFTRIESASFFS